MNASPRDRVEAALVGGTSLTRASVTFDGAADAAGLAISCGR